LKKIFLYLTLITLLGIGPAGLLLSKPDDQRSFKEESLQTFQQDKNFQYGTQPLPEMPKIKKRDADLGLFIEALMYIAIFVIIIVLVYFVAKNTVAKSSKKIALGEIPELTDKDIKEVSFNDLIAKAAAAGNYRKAVRLLYLESLKALDQKGWIKWKLYKTNYEYQLELIGTHLQKDFDQLTYHFEYIWYGHFSIDETTYQQLEKRFREFQSGILSGK
jgi:hypothetical protein